MAEYSFQGGWFKKQTRDRGFRWLHFSSTWYFYVFLFFILCWIDMSILLWILLWIFTGISLKNNEIKMYHLPMYAILFFFFSHSSFLSIERLSLGGFWESLFIVVLDSMELAAIFLPQSPSAMISQSILYEFGFEYVYHGYCLRLRLQYKAWRSQFTSFPPFLVLFVCHLINTCLQGHSHSVL